MSWGNLVDFLNNREMAIALWIIAIAIYTFSADKAKDIRKSFTGLISAFFVSKIISILMLLAIYMGMVIYLMAKIDLWDATQIKNTVFWAVSVGFMSLFKLESIKKDKSFFKHSVADNLKLLAIIQFIVGVYTFPLWVELLLVPVLAVIGGMAAVAESDEKYSQVKRLIDVILALFSAFVIAYTAYMLITNFGKFGQEETVYDFIVPILLTLSYIPFIFVMMIYSTYEQVFISLRSSIKENKYRVFAKIYAVAFFNFQLSLLERWSNQLAIENIDSHRKLINSFSYMCKVKRPGLF
jgi:hypothetical protein